MIEIKVVNVLNHQSSIYVTFDVKSLNDDKSGFITARHVRNGAYDEVAILKMTDMTTNQAHINKTKIGFDIGIHSCKFKIIERKHWNGMSRLIVNVHDKFMKLIHTIEVKCPVEITKSPRLSKTNDTSLKAPNIKKPRTSRIVLESDDEEIYSFETSEPESDTSEVSEPELEKVAKGPSFWDLIHAIDMMKSEQTKILDDEIRVEESIINGLEVELQKHKNILNDIHIKKRKIERISG